MVIAIKIASFFMSCIYQLMKLFGIKKRVCFISRQSDLCPIDYVEIQKLLKEKSPETEIVTLYNRYRDSRDGVFKFLLMQFKSMYLISTSEVCVLDAYWPVISMFKHKKSLKIIQLWHSNGKFKKSGYQILGKSGGRNPKIAKALKMHKNYDYVIAGGKSWNRFYCEAFLIEESKIRNYGLPRLDILVRKSNIRKSVLDRYPDMVSKKVILYVPTYRKYSMEIPAIMEKELNSDSSLFITRFHPNQKIINGNYTDKYGDLDTMELVKICDYLITDYSSLSLEAAALDKKIIFYTFDHDSYIKQHGLNVDISLEFPDLSFESADKLVSFIIEDSYPDEQLKEFKERYLPDEIGKATEKIVNLILEKE